MIQPGPVPRLSRLSSALRALAWLGLTLVLLVAGVARWSSGHTVHLADLQMACAVGASLLALLGTAYTVAGRSRSAALALIYSAAAAGGWVALLFL